MVRRVFRCGLLVRKAYVELCVCLIEVISCELCLRSGQRGCSLLQAPIAACDVVIPVFDCVMDLSVW